MRSSFPVSGGAFVESLEPRQFFSVSVGNAVAPSLVPSVTPQLTAAKTTLLAPSAVEGTYKGVMVGSDGASAQIKVVIAKTSAKFTIEGLGSYTHAITAAEFKLLREEKPFTFSGSTVISGKTIKLTFSGQVKDSGLKITGNYTTNISGRNGTFDVKK